MLFKIKTVYFTKEHKKYLKELEQYKECEFDFREIYEGNIDYDYNDACTKYNKKIVKTSLNHIINIQNHVVKHIMFLTIFF